MTTRQWWSKHSSIHNNIILHFVSASVVLGFSKGDYHSGINSALNSRSVQGERSCIDTQLFGNINDINVRL